MSRGVGWDLWVKKYAPIDTRITNLEDTYVKACWFEEISSGTSGTLTLPTGGAVVLNQWDTGVDALASVVSSSWPTFESPVTSSGTVITATLDAAGAWTLSDTPSAYPIAIIYVYRVKLSAFDDSSSMFEAELELNLQDLTEKTTPVTGDLLLIADSAAANARKRIQIGNLPAATPAAHTITSHSDVVDATGAQLEELTGAGDTTLHDHDGIAENTAARHAESHSIASHNDTTATGTELETLTGGGDTTLHDHDGIAENTAARHTQGTDTALGSGAVAADHGTAATDQVINVSYGTGNPPTASTTTEGSLFVKYTA